MTDLLRVGLEVDVTQKLKEGCKIPLIALALNSMGLKVLRKLDQIGSLLLACLSFVMSSESEIGGKDTSNLPATTSSRSPGTLQ